MWFEYEFIVNDIFVKPSDSNLSLCWRVLYTSKYKQKCAYKFNINLEHVKSVTFDNIISII